MAACAKATSATPKCWPRCARPIGPDVTLMVDVQYLWEDAATCLQTVKDWARVRHLLPGDAALVRQCARDGEAGGAGADADRLRRMAGDALRVRGADGCRQGAGGAAGCRPRRRHRRGQDRLRHGEGARPHHRAALLEDRHLDLRPRRISPSSPTTAPSSSTCRRSSATSGCAASWRRRSWCCAPTARFRCRSSPAWASRSIGTSSSATAPAKFTSKSIYVQALRILVVAAYGPSATYRRRQTVSGVEGLADDWRKDFRCLPNSGH